MIQEPSATKTQAQKLKIQEIEKYVRNRVNHDFNKQTFEEELNDQINKNLGKMQENIVKDLKRKMIIKMQEDQDLEKREKTKKQIQEKLCKSQEMREKEMKKKTKNMKMEKKYKQKLFNERLSKIKEDQRMKTLQKLKKIEEKDKHSSPKLNQIEGSGSLNEEPHYQRKLHIQEMEYNRMKSKVERKDVFRDTRVNIKKMSLVQLKPRETEHERNEKERINKLGEHLDKIDETRKKRSKMINDRIKGSQLEQKYQAQQRSERVKSMMKAQKQRQKHIIQKLSKSRPQLLQSTPTLRNPSSCQNVQRMSPQSRYFPQRSIIYNNLSDNWKQSYRKQIKEQIKQYMLTQKNKLLISK